MSNQYYDNKIFILGSCVSRDIFNFPNDFSIVNYCARTSFASIFSSSFGHGEYADKLDSKFQASMLKDDLLKRVRKYLVECKYDFLLIDFIDERFNLILSGDSIATKSSELLRSGLQYETDNCYEVKSESIEFIMLWEKGWKEFIGLLTENNLREKLVLNKVYWAERTESGGGFSPGLPDEKIKKMNAFLDKLYSIAEKDIQKSHIMTQSRQQFIGDDNHRWGKAPFHYTKAYYKNALSFLKHLNNTDRTRIFISEFIEFVLKPESKNVVAAFYLYKGGEKIDTQWYSKCFSYKLDSNRFGPGKYRIRYFIVDESEKDPGKSKKKEQGYSLTYVVDE